MFFCVACATAVVGRAAYIQIGRDPRLENMAKRQFQSKLLIRPRRGLIMDRNGEPLAVNAETKSLAANPSKIQNKRTLARLLAKATNQPFAKMLGRIGGEREFVWIKRDIPEKEFHKFRKWGLLGEDGELVNGLFLVKEEKRIYPHAELASHVLGSVNLDSEGLEGVELRANEQLRGKVVSVSAVKDALGRPTFIDVSASKSIQDGEALELTLDASLQYSAETELKAAVAKTGGKGGSVIVMNSVTGEILAMANEPSYDPNQKGVPAWRRRNRALTDGYEPGSTMKAVLLAGALSHGSKLSDKVYAEHGTFTVQGKRISEAEAHEKFDWISLDHVIKVSSNVGAAKIALHLGAEAYHNTLKTFGFGGKTGTGFPGEISGRMPARENWQPLSVANVGFGQGILVTPIQMLRAYATFANGGWLVQPTLFKSKVEGVASDAPKRIISERVAQDVTTALREVTEEGGTGIKAALDGYEIAGKTGTAQMVDPETGRYSRSKYIASFIGFATNVQPNLVIFASIDEPKGVYYAGETAAPLFREVLNAAVTRFSIPATAPRGAALAKNAKDHKGRSTAGSLLAKAQAASSARVVSPGPNELHDRIQLSLAKVVDPVEPQGKTTEGASLWKMPSLQGLTAREAIQTLQGHRFHVEMHGIGVVKTQAPEDGKIIADGSKIRLTLTEP